MTHTATVCHTCAAAVVNADMSAFAFDPAREARVTEFLEQFGVAAYLGDTADADPTDYCAACNEPIEESHASLLAAVWPPCPANA